MRVVLALAVVACLQITASTRQINQESSQAQMEAQKQARAALAFARAVAAEGTPEFTMALRKALALAQELPGAPDLLRSAPIATDGLGFLDRDPRYRRNVMAILAHQQGIVGGEDTRVGDYQDTVAVLGNGELCTGTIIADDAVLTAAHCYCKGIKNQVLTGEQITAPVQTIDVMAGTSMIACSADLRGGDVAVLRLRRGSGVCPAWIVSMSVLRQA